GQFYALSFIQKTCNIEFVQSNYIIATALLIATPLFIFFGWWSDHVGRKYIMMTGMILGVLLYRPIYQKMYSVSDVSKKTELVDQRSIERTTSYNSSGDTVVTTSLQKTFHDKTVQAEVRKHSVSKNNIVVEEIKKETTLSGINYWWLVGLIAVQVIFVTMV